MQKSQTYFNNKAKIDKANHTKTAYKIQFYNNKKVDELVKNFNTAGISSKTPNSVLTAELSMLNKPEVYKNYNHIINSKFTSNDNFFKMLVRNKAQTSLDNIVKNEVERISKNLNYVEQVMKKYEVPTKEYEKLVAQQKNNSLANRQEILKDVAIKANDLLVSERLNIPSAYSYINLETSAQSMLRQSQMTADFEEAKAINENYINDGKDAIYTQKVWIHTDAGATTRHMSNHMQRVRFDEPFIVVNDATLDIDEMMYPCDPAGSPSNSYICYCEVEYENDDGEVDTDGINLNQSVFDINTNALTSTPSVNFDTTVGSLKDKIPTLTSVPQFVPKNTVSEFINNKIKGTPDKLPEKEYITESDLSDGHHSNVLQQTYIYEDMGIVENGGKHYFKGLDVSNYWDNSNKWAKVPDKAIYEHNKKTDGYVEPKIVKEPIEVDKLDYFEEDNTYCVTKSYGLQKIEGEVYYKGLEVTEYSTVTGNTAFIPAEAIIEHNAELGEKTFIVENKSIPKEPITKKDLEYCDFENGEYIIPKFDIKFENGKAYFKGAEITAYYDVDAHFATVPEDILILHNKKLGYGSLLAEDKIIDNKYIELMDKSIEPVEEAGDIYLVDKKTGKKFLYDEKGIYENYQDNAQYKVKYGKSETDSTAHWGRYGHQILNGLLYKIEKYGYDNYAPQLDKALPQINKIRKMHKDNFKGLDTNGNPIYKDYSKINKEIDKLGKIIDRTERRNGCDATLKDIKNAMWEMVYMDKAMIESPALLQDTFLVRFGHFDKSLCKKGESIKFDGYMSTTYESGSASHFESKMKDNPDRWAILIMADEGTSGIRLNSQFNALTSEREWCLPRDNEFEVVEYNINQRTVVLKAKKNKLYNGG